MLRLSGLTCERGGQMLFRGLDLSLGDGHCVAVRGANGCGKSTLLRIAAGLYTQHEGQAHARPASYLGHSNGISGLLSPRQNLAIAAGLAQRDADPVLAEVGLGRQLDTPCRHLSRGQQRRIALARLRLEGRPLWLLDEPLAGLDTAGVNLLRVWLDRHLAAGGGVLCATHQPLGCETQTLELGTATDAGS